MPKWTEEQQLAIYEKDKNIIVSAGAGSGKTAVLSERVLEHVKNGIDVDDLLILTFTNAAAAEMKERIRKKISSIPELKNQLDKIDIAYITTFDAYALSTVKRYNQHLNISDKINIIDSSIIELKKKEILEEIFEEQYNQNNPSFINLINDFCLKDDEEVKKSILYLNNKLDNLPNKEELLNNYISNYYTDSNISTLVTNYLNIILDKIKTMSIISDNLSRYVDKSYIEKLYEVLNPILNTTKYEEIRLLITTIKLPVLRNSCDEAKVIKNEISNLIKEVKELTNYNTLEEIKETLYSTKSNIEEILYLIKELDNRVTKYKQDNDSYEFIDISKLAIKILKENKDIREELKYKYKEILIDEYQDTNDLQDIFISYIENNNVYMVGDIKQSIYRFRNANPLLFKSKYDSYAKNINGYKIDLNRNFRSRSEVLDNINLMFNLLMDNKIGGADYITSHQMIFGLTPYNNISKEDYNMSILNYSIEEDTKYSKEEIEIFAIAKDIKDKIDNKYTMMDKETMEEKVVDYSDFCILMDRSSSFENYKKIFEYLNIPLTIYRDKTISDSIDISIIKNIYNLILLTKKKDYKVSFAYSFMAVSRSYLFSISDKDILKIIKDRTYFDTPLYKIINELSKELNELNNKELYSKIIDKFDFYNRIITIGNINEHIITLDSINKIVNNTSNFGISPEEFYNYLCDVEKNGLDIKLSLNKETSNSVKIMTIHASKGLEYPICYFSGLSKKFNIDDLKNKFYYDNQIGFIIPYIKDGMKTSISKILLKQKYIEEEISEKLRLFYVALTRAREKMILVGSFEENILSYKDNGVINNETRIKYRSFKDMLDSIYPYIKKYITNINLEELNLTKDYNLSKYKSYKELISNQEGIRVEEISIQSKDITKQRFSKHSNKLLSKDDYKNIKLGLKMHKVFEDLDFNNPNLSNLNTFEVTCITNFLNTHILDNTIRMYKEYEFNYIDDQVERTGIIDLLLEKEDTCIIIDYKLKNTQDEAYINQVNGYKKFVEKNLHKKTSTYLYSIIDAKLIEIK